MKKDIEISWNNICFSDIDGGTCELSIYVKEFDLAVHYTNIHANWDFSIFSHRTWDLPEERNDEIDFDYSDMIVTAQFKGVDYELDETICKMAMALVGRPHEYEDKMIERIF